MALITTPAVVLSSLRYGETSKIVRLATRDHGVQSAIAKGALRPRSRFGAALQLLSVGVAHLIAKEGRELHLLTAFDVIRVPIALAGDLERYAAAGAMAETMLRFAAPDPHPDSYDAFTTALAELEAVPAHDAAAAGLRGLWRVVASLGFAPVLDVCARDGAALPPAGPIAFSARDGGALCPACAAHAEATRLPADARAALEALAQMDASLPVLDSRHAAAHRRLLARFIRSHLGEGADLPALEFWERSAWAAA
jgi:DNA repair protein RecO (recombination protein O)